MSRPISNLKIGRKQYGVAGQYGYMVSVQYAPNEEPYETLFSANSYGGPFFAGLYQIDHATVERCGGVLNPAFIRKFYQYGGN